MKCLSVRKPEHGAALVISLVLITVASIGAVTAMRSGHLQDRMASNQHNKVISQMAAEAGASAFIDWVHQNSNQDLATAWSSSALRTLPTNAQLPPHGFYYLPNSPTWNTNPVVAVVYGLSRKNGQTLAETRIRLVLANSGSFDLTLPGTMSIGGPLSAFIRATSNSFAISGGSTGYAIVTDQSYPTAVTTVRTAIQSNPSREANYTGPGTATNSVTSMPLGATWGDPNALKQLVEVAKTKMPNGQAVSSLADCGSLLVCVVSSSDPTNISTTLQTKLLVITGTMSTSGSPAWAGLVVVLGGQLSWGGGGGGGTIPGYQGAIYIANVLQPTTGSWTFNPVGSIVNISGGGNAQFNYDAQNIASAIGLLSGWSVASWREIL